MLTNFEKYHLEVLFDDLVKQYQDAIRNNPIERRTKRRGVFRSPVNASGRLANSVEFLFTDTGAQVVCLAYVDKLIFGQPPRGEIPTLSEIENWMVEKGLDYQAANVATGLDRYGSSIWQRWQGENSGLFSNVKIEEGIKDLEQKLLQNYGGLIAAELIQLAA